MDKAIANLLKIKMCDECYEWVTSNRNLSAIEMWNKCERGDWMMRLVDQYLDLLPPQKFAILMCQLIREIPLARHGRTTWDLLPGDHYRVFIESIEKRCHYGMSFEEAQTAASVTFTIYDTVMQAATCNLDGREVRKLAYKAKADIIRRNISVEDVVRALEGTKHE